MRNAVYPGTFNPFHKGHVSIVRQALQVFDTVYVLRLQNPDKPVPPPMDPIWLSGVKVPEPYKGLLRDWIEDHNSLEDPDDQIHGVIRGIRGAGDIQEALEYKFWNEDLGLKIPIIHFLPSRETLHYSSSAIRGLGKFGVYL